MQKLTTFINKAFAVTLAAVAFVFVASCGQTNPMPSAGKLVISAITLQVGEKAEIKAINLSQGETVVYTAENDTVRIIDGIAEAMLAGQRVKVSAKSSFGRTGEFYIDIDQDIYSPTADSESEDWFKPFAIDSVDNIGDDFPLGIDISTLQAVIDAGGKFYNSDNIRQNVYAILKNSGVNYVRLRLWNDPYAYSAEGKIAYGAGICDLNNVISMAAEAKLAGLNVLLDFHYSDFWAHPGQQVMPKEWIELNDSDAIAGAIYEYTQNVLAEMDSKGAKPDMVQLGNEITDGLLLQSGGEDNLSQKGDNPDYITNKKPLGSHISGLYGSTNMTKYLAKANDAVKNFDSDILTMIHIAKGMSGTDYILNFYKSVQNIDYDIIGLSYYPYYHGSIAQLKKTLSALSKAFSSRKIAIAEISYGFTFLNNANANNIYYNTAESGKARPVYGYATSPSGQANLIADTVRALKGIDNGYGIFYWEGCWIPVAGVGWADSTTKNSWANQALFSYDGKALPSLSVFKQIKQVS